MKEIICTAVGFGAGMLSWIVGGFDTPILALIGICCIMFAKNEKYLLVQ